MNDADDYRPPNLALAIVLGVAMWAAAGWFVVKLWEMAR